MPINKRNKEDIDWLIECYEASSFIISPARFKNIFIEHVEQRNGYGNVELVGVVIFKRSSSMRRFRTELGLHRHIEKHKQHKLDELDVI